MNPKSIPKQKIPFGDRMISYATCILAFVLLVLLPELLSYSHTATGWLMTLATPLGVLMLALSPAMYYGFLLKRQCLVHDRLEQEEQDLRTPLERSILIRCRYKPTEEGTKWELTNANPFPWSRAKFLIERTLNRETSTDKIELGQVLSSEKRVVDSQLEEAVGARWRIMVISWEGKMLDYPDRWSDTEWATTDMQMWN